ncbi:MULTISPECIES: NifX-associated nitrogen fixation protein [Okeania]|uniref:NifX-associated nitrogen fixation protein n=1 Tax=Okeania hirsuta TaxID=1458930 RepID=A0A3N6RBM1_9CYAN|nr:MULTISPECIES: NifX-associated nitrogen fixation protein [Okeania]NET13936.1 NifX-associated nitrogen fixation protein [Okeania sp. SIO1H6]NES74459.1 NifX-associated nitrogen fixation protein [Okeania sp. SIO1H4]NES87773.1 NifX-associated nitrogen fixation protein [Okeania sp. SIO2B9]NET18058.1 NifX-associated nitrogen fixation protein [Okeania sp. SIO1H5]NET76330.1 NifX-associated nitrogen fixation protein [Okeania sp. SIO1F9]
MTVQTETTTTTTDIYSAPFIRELIRAVQAQDSYGVYKSWSPELIIKPYIVSKQEKRQISTEEEVNPMTLARIKLFYNAIATCIELETNQIMQVVISINHEGFGWALVFCGRLLVVSRTLRDAQRFGFTSLEKLEDEGEKMSRAGIELVKKYKEVCKL